MLRCSSRIFVPIKISIIPPMMLAGFEYFAPKKFPIATPAKLNKKVVTPIINIARQISTIKNAKVTPTAKASMLVATASRNIVLVLFLFLFLSLSFSSSKASLIMFAPMRKRSPKAIQWSIFVIRLSN